MVSNNMCIYCSNKLKDRSNPSYINMINTTYKSNNQYNNEFNTNINFAE